MSYSKNLTCFLYLLKVMERAEGGASAEEQIHIPDTVLPFRFSELKIIASIAVS